MEDIRVLTSLQVEPLIPGPELAVVITPPEDAQNTVTGNTAATVKTVDPSPSPLEPRSWTLAMSGTRHFP